jgi:glycosyltransferase involved in cell wall biosynthesis
VHILLIEPYSGGSHHHFVAGFIRHTRHQVTRYELPARFWKWRMHGAAVTFARRLRADYAAWRGRSSVPDAHATREAASWPPVEAVFASDMLDLATFYGLAGELLAGVPAVMYFHENQLTYPPPPGEKRDLHYGWINYTSALLARRLLFNSAYHRDAFLAELPRLLKHFPDYHDLTTVDEIRAKSQVLPLGCDLARHDGAWGDARDLPGSPEASGKVGRILWNQRWEYDKRPDEFFRALYQLIAEGYEFEVILAGQNFRNVPVEFETARDRLGPRLVHYGYADPATYSRLLWQADIVVSTAIHEFFGLAVVEACYCGCYPILPRRLSYPELIPPAAHARHLYDDFAGLLDRLRWALEHKAEMAEYSLRDHMAQYDWSQLINAYDEILEGLLA